LPNAQEQRFYAENSFAFDWEHDGVNCLGLVKDNIDLEKQMSVKNKSVAFRRSQICHKAQQQSFYRVQKSSL